MKGACLALLCCLFLLQTAVGWWWWNDLDWFTWRELSLASSMVPVQFGLTQVFVLIGKFPLPSQFGICSPVSLPPESFI